MVHAATPWGVAIDGGKFKAVNNRDKNFTRAKVEWRHAQLEGSITRYLTRPRPEADMNAVVVGPMGLHNLRKL